MDDLGAWDATRLRACQLAAGMAHWAQSKLPRRVARWTDEYEARAFGEGFQRAGISTVLVETGALPGDPEKELLRTHLTHLLLSTLASLADGSWQQADPQWYHDLPDNHTVDHDLHLTGGTVVVDGREHRADVALLFQDPVARTGPALAELGDLGTATALERIDCTGAWIVLTPQNERSPGAVAPEDFVVVELRKDGPDGPITAAY